MVDTAINLILNSVQALCLPRLTSRVPSGSSRCTQPTAIYVLGMNWNNQVCIDTCLPFGLRSALKLFNILADLLSWIIKRKDMSSVLHNLYDFLTMDRPASVTCRQNLNIIKDVCAPGLKKLECPTKSLIFLGIVFDAEHMGIRLPEDNTCRIRR